MLQKNGTKNGTVKSTVMPCTIATMINSLPETLDIIGNVVSAVVAPPAQIGANFPNRTTIIGAKSRVMISRIMFEISATVPSSAPLYSVMKIDDSE